VALGDKLWVNYKTEAPRSAGVQELTLGAGRIKAVIRELALRLHSG